MFKKIKELSQRQSLRQFIKFCFVGVSGTAVDWVIYFAFTRWLHVFYLIAKTISFVIAAGNNYVWNRIWTFRSKETKIIKEFSKFLLVSIVGLLLNTAIMYVSVSLWHWYDLWGLVLATALVMFWNFFANKLWTFKETK